MDGMTQKSKNRVDFLINLVYYAAIVALAYLAIRYALGWVLPFFLAFCIVSIVNPVIRFVDIKMKFSHRAASVTVMIVIYALVGFLLFELILQLFYVMRDVFTQLPSYYTTTLSPAFTKLGENIESLFNKLPINLTAQLYGLQNDLLGEIQSWLVRTSQSGMSYVSAFTGRIPAFVIAFVFTVMLTFFIGSQYDQVTAFLKAQLPGRLKGMVSELKMVINDIILRYIKAIFKLMLITFVELTIGLLVLRTENAIFIALGIAVFDALPFFGTGAIMIPWALIELIQANYTFALGLGILYAIVTVVRNILEPHIVGQKLGLNPIVSIVAIYLGFKIFGIFGMIFMPIVTQIALELHKKSVIKLYNPVKLPEPEEDDDKKEETPAGE
jgi:sporulation integral membrane protein YtvI